MWDCFAASSGAQCLALEAPPPASTAYSHLWMCPAWWEPFLSQRRPVHEARSSYRISCTAYGSAAVLFSLHTSDWLQVPMHPTICLPPGRTANILVRCGLPPSEPAVLRHSNDLFAFAYSIALDICRAHSLYLLAFCSKIRFQTGHRWIHMYL